jgi:hypothetical protein
MAPRDLIAAAISRRSRSGPARRSLFLAASGCRGHRPRVTRLSQLPGGYQRWFTMAAISLP